LLAAYERQPFVGAETVDIHWCQNEIVETMRPGHILVTMSESTEVSETIANALAVAKAVIVPSRWNKVVFQRYTKAPIHVVNLGADTSAFEPNLNAFPRGAIFITAGRTQSGRDRKGLDRVIAAFLYAFPKEQDVVLQVKATPGDSVLQTYSPKVQVMTNDVPQSELVRWYQEALCYVSGSTGEGWGWHLHEAMLCGKPVISTTWSGPSEFFRPRDHGYEVEYDLLDCPSLGGLRGKGAVPRIESLAKQMRFVYNNRVDAFMKGLQAAIDLKRLTIDKFQSEIVKVISHYV
jgi:glycosyltransferase involved in cell wall biosynthesis